MAKTYTRIGPYRVISELGSGGMGRVDLAASKSGRAVAIKVVRAELAADPGFRHRFKTEVDAARKVSGAFTSAVVDADPDGPLPWLATAYVPSPTLRDAIDTHGPMPEPSLRVLAAGLAEALVAIHHAGLIHRNLKPSNILLATDGPRVIDFGISKAVDGVIGSAGYMSPEHASGAPVTPASDVFSLGAVMAFAATGRPPFGEGPIHAVMFRAAHEQPRLDGVPPALVGLVAACLDKDPARRPPANHLPGWLQPGPTTIGWLGPVADELAVRERAVIKAVKTPVLKRRGILIGGGILGAAAAGGAAYLLWRKPGATGPRLKWTATLPKPEMVTVAVSDSTVVCHDQTGAASFERSTGQALWDGTGRSDRSVRTDGKHVFSVRTDGNLHAVDARTGKDLWTSTASGDQAPTLRLLSPTTIVTSTIRGRHYGITVADGSRRWSFDVPGSTGSGAQVLAEPGQLALLGGASTKNYHNKPNGYTVLSLDNGTMLWSADFVTLHAPSAGRQYCAIDDDMHIVGLDAATGRRLWRQPTTFQPAISVTVSYDGSLHLEQGTVICYPGKGNASSSALVAFDAADGRALWSVKVAGEDGGFGQCVVAGQAFCYFDNGLRAIELRTGNPLWNVGDQLGSMRFLGSLNDMILTAVDNSKGQGGLYGWDAKTGEQAWHFRVDGGSGHWGGGPVPGGLFVTYSGKLYAFQVEP